jgi:hypothetical protein
MEYIGWVKENWHQVLVLVGLLFGSHGVIELITRLTPTKSDDGFTTTVGKKIDHLLDMAGVPNKLKDDK